MELRPWRLSKNLTLQQLAPIFGMSVSALSALERGMANVSNETMARIEGATGGEVTAASHFAAWRRANVQDFTEHRAAGRRAMAAFKPPKPRRKTNGKKRR